MNYTPTIDSIYWVVKPETLEYWASTWRNDDVDNFRKRAYRLFSSKKGALEFIAATAPQLKDLA